MAFDFSQLSDIASTIGSLYSTMSQGNNPVNAANNNAAPIPTAPGSVANTQATGNVIQQIMDAIALQQNLLKASVDPTNAWNQNLTASLRNKLQEDAAKSVFANELMRRRMIARGYSPANSSRVDEGNAKALAEAFINAGLTAQQYANKSLATAAATPVPTGASVLNALSEQQALNNSWANQQAGLQQNLLPYTYANATAKNQNRANLYSGLPQIFSGMANVAQSAGVGDWISGLFGSNDAASNFDFGASNYGISLPDIGSGFDFAGLF